MSNFIVVLLVGLIAVIVLLLIVVLSRINEVKCPRCKEDLFLVKELKRNDIYKCSSCETVYVDYGGDSLYEVVGHPPLPKT